MLAALIVILGIIVAAAAYLLRYDFPPFAIGFGYLFIALLLCSFRLARGQAWAYNMAFVFLALAIAEFWFRDDGAALRLKGDTHYEGSYSAGYFQRDNDLGFSIQPGRRTVDSVKKFNSGKLIYQTAYTFDEFGQRETPNVSSAKDAVFFFGCSFTFGEGVKDGDSLPYQFSVLSGRRARNFGLHGYGPHQMLRALETDRAARLGIPETPSLVVYTALMTHLDRAAGRAVWDTHGPHYQVRNGQAEYTGTFSQAWQKPRPWLTRLLAHSRVAGRIASAHQSDLDRFSAIIRRSRDLVAAKYNAKFLVLLWDVAAKQQPTADADWLVAQLKHAGIDVLRLSEILPVLQAHEYYIPDDLHPQGKAYREVAKAIYSWTETQKSK